MTDNWRETVTEQLATFITEYFEENLATSARWAFGRSNTTFAQAILDELLAKLLAATGRPSALATPQMTREEITGIIAECAEAWPFKHKLEQSEIEFLGGFLVGKVSVREREET